MHRKNSKGIYIKMLPFFPFEEVMGKHSIFSMLHASLMSYVFIQKIYITFEMRKKLDVDIYAYIYSYFMCNMFSKTHFLTRSGFAFIPPPDLQLQSAPSVPCSFSPPRLYSCYSFCLECPPLSP